MLYQKLLIKSKMVSLISLLLLLSCSSQSTEFIFDRIVESSVKKLVKKMEWVELASKKIGIVRVGKDSTGIVRDELMRHISKIPDIILLSMAEHKNMDRIMETQSIILRDEDFYEKSSLKRLGRLLSPEIILVARVQSAVVSSAGGKIIIRADLLDLENGTVIWTDKTVASFQSESYKNRNLIIFIICIPLLLLLYWGANTISGGYYKKILITAVILIMATLFYFLNLINWIIK